MTFATRFSMINASEEKRDFFVSFSKADNTCATWIASALEEAGYSVFFQDWDFKGNFVLEIDRAHTQSRRTIAVLSPDYLASRFTAPEWAARFAQDATSQHDLLIPVRVRPCELEGLLGQIVYVDLVGCDEATAKKRLFTRVSGIRTKPDESPLYPSSPAGHRESPHSQSSLTTLGLTINVIALEATLVSIGQPTQIPAKQFCSSQPSPPLDVSTTLWFRSNDGREFSLHLRNITPPGREGTRFTLLVAMGEKGEEFLFGLYNHSALSWTQLNGFRRLLSHVLKHCLTKWDMLLFFLAGVALITCVLVKDVYYGPSWYFIVVGVLCLISLLIVNTVRCTIVWRFLQNARGKALNVA